MKKTWGIIAIVLCLMLGIGTFFDLDIAQAVFKKDNYFSYFFEHLAPVVFATVNIIGASLLLFTRRWKTDNKLIIFLSGIGFIFFTFLGVLLSYNYLKLFGLIYGILATVIAAVCVTKIPKELRSDYAKAGLAIVLTSIVSMFIVEGIKPIWGRVRFRSMQENFDLFTRWYSVNGAKYLTSVPAKEEIKSFPSGHSQWVGNTLSLSLLFLVNPKLRDKENLVIGIAAAYAGIVMFSRMMQGAHFLSDVTIGFSIAFACFILFRKVIVTRSINL
ncbi:phosphatase PAP2 family protein [Enterococcus sp. AZ196]|uniref:phosphatase PAP2 family protein n=1 Tax=Enterococcus sp. AZ196 TaxID=2774659 RepID=UPI003D2D19D6